MKKKGSFLTKHRHLISTIVFLAGLLIILAIFSFAVRPEYGSVYNIAKINMKMDSVKMEAPDTIDVLFGGNSLVVNGVSPLRLWSEKGITSYIVGENSQRLCDSYELLRECKDTQSPSIFVIEADTVFSDASPYKNNYALPTNAIENILPIFHYHIFYKQIFSGESEIEDENIWKGYEGDTYIKPYIPDGTYMTASDPAVIEYDSLVYLEKIRSYCNDEGIALVIIALPAPGSWSLGRSAAMTEWAAANGADFLDLNLCTEEIGIDWDNDMRDGEVHLNDNGATKVTDYIGNYLAENYSPDDHRGDPAYKSFDDALKLAEDTQ